MTVKTYFSILLQRVFVGAVDLISQCYKLPELFTYLISKAIVGAYWGPKRWLSPSIGSLHPVPIIDFFCLPVMKNKWKLLSLIY